MCIINDENHSPLFSKGTEEPDTLMEHMFTTRSGLGGGRCSTMFLNDRHSIHGGLDQITNDRDELDPRTSEVRHQLLRLRVRRFFGQFTHHLDPRI